MCECECECVYMCVCVCVQMRSGLRLQHVGGGPSCRRPVARMEAPAKLKQFLETSACVCVLCAFCN